MNMKEGLFLNRVGEVVEVVLKGGVYTDKGDRQYGDDGVFLSCYEEGNPDFDLVAEVEEVFLMTSMDESTCMFLWDEQEARDAFLSRGWEVEVGYLLRRRTAFTLVKN